jgi:hypothetical protein
MSTKSETPCLDAAIGAVTYGPLSILGQKAIDSLISSFLGVSSEAFNRGVSFGRLQQKAIDRQAHKQKRSGKR